MISLWAVAWSSNGSCRHIRAERHVDPPAHLVLKILIGRLTIWYTVCLRGMPHTVCQRTLLEVAKTKVGAHFGWLAVDDGASRTQLASSARARATQQVGGTG